MAEVSPSPNITGLKGSLNIDPTSMIKEVVAPLQEHACQLEPLSTGTFGDVISIGGQGNIALAHCPLTVNIYHTDKPNSASAPNQSTSSLVLKSSSIESASSHLQEKPTENPVPKPLEQRKVIIVAPFGSEIEHESDCGMIMNVWFCWNEGNEYQEILKSEHTQGKIILESYDTFAMHHVDDRRFENKIQVSISPQPSSSWIPDGCDSKEVIPQNVFLGRKARCSFRLKKEQPVDDDNDHLYLTLLITQSVSEERREVQFLLRKKTLALRMTKQLKTELEEGVCHANVTGKSTRAFLAAPFIDLTKEVNDDIILSLWICPSDDENILFKNLEKEQKIQCRSQFDSPTPFIPSKWDKPISAEVKVHSNQWIIKPSVVQEMEIFKLVNGGRAKFQFLCNATGNLDRTKIDIFLRQQGEDTETEFLISPNVNSLKKDKFEIAMFEPAMESVTNDRLEVRESFWNNLCSCFRFRERPRYDYDDYVLKSGDIIRTLESSPTSHVIGVLLLAELGNDDQSSFAVTLMLCKISSLSTQLQIVQNSGSILLDSYDTCIIKYRLSNVDQNVLKVSYYGEDGAVTTKDLAVADLESNNVATCKFQCSGDLKAGVQGTLEISESYVFGTLEIFDSDVFEHIPVLKQRIMVNEYKLGKFQILNDQIASYNFPHDENDQIYIAVPYVDPIRNMSDDVIITVWICSYFRKNEIEALAKEQDIIGRIKLDTDNPFLVVNYWESIAINVTLPIGWSTVDVTQMIELRRLSQGYRAKAQFICKTSQMEDESSTVDIDITMSQTKEANEIQFLTRNKMGTFLRQTQMDVETEPLPSTVKGEDRSFHESRSDEV